MKVFCLVPNPHANGTGLNFKSNLCPAALACFTKRENFKNFAAREYCADRKDFKIFASDEIKFATHGEPKFTTRSIAKFTACSWLKFEPRSTATRSFGLRDKILNPRPCKSRASFKISSRRGEKTK
ncbi:hypothetical protein [uncultured Campylobacter sp.]|uniref:hypothetical protein n=1 Tax=uncultured Campylobacter sp. TaxID=218934 RepID=UPI00261DAA2D|nr:hypothetical protein [uncultured Campylobacter sp.]